jgi:CRISP-associated protein Cas1
VTAQAMGEVLEKGVHLAYFTSQGKYRGSVWPPRGKNIDLRLAQFEQYRDGARTLKFAHSFVKAKIENGISVINGYVKSGDATTEMRAGRDRLMEMAAGIEASGDLAALEGAEGAAARLYFELLMGFNRSELAWGGRRRHPSPDPLNALLSLAYTLLTHELAALAEGMGLDSYLGFMHQPDYGRQSLALDLVEAFRHPIADRMVLTLVNKKVLAPGNFQQDGVGACWLEATRCGAFSERLRTGCCRAAEPSLATAPFCVRRWSDLRRR